MIVLGLGGYRVKNQMDGKKYQTFNDAVVNAYQGTGSEDDPMSSIVETWTEGRPIDRSQLQSAYDASMAEVESIEDKLKAIDVPSKASARAFHQKATEFIGLRREMLERAYRPLIGMLSNSDTKQSQVDAQMESTLGAMLPRIMTALSEVDTAQKVFAKEVGLKLQ